MTDYTYEIPRAPDNHPHTALQLLYAEERKEITEAFYTTTNTKGEQPIAPRESAPDTAGMPPEGFNGA